MDSSRAIQNPKGWSYQVAFSKSGRHSSGHRVGKGQSSSQFPRRVVLKNVQTIRQLHSSPMLVRSCLKILHVMLQRYANQELPDIQARLRKSRGTRDQIVNILWIIEKAREFQKNIHLCFIDYAKAFDCVDHNKLWKALKDTGIPDYLTCLLRNLYVSEEATVRTLYGTTDQFKIKKGVLQSSLLPSCLFNLYAERIMRNAGLYELQAGIKTGGRNISKLQICGWYHSNGRKWRGTKEPLDEDEGGEWKSQLKTKY